MPEPQTAPVLPSARSAKRLLAHLAESQWAQHQWALTGLGLALLVLLVLPRAQINLAASQLHGLIGSYTDPGHYNVAYSGGTTTINTNPPTNYSAATSQNAPGAWGGGGNVYGTGTVSASCAGQITAAFTWSPGPNNAPAPPAGSVIVTETANAAWSGPGSTGSCGLPNFTTSSNAPNQTGTRYSVQGGSSFSVNCTPTASLSGYTAPGGQVIGGGVYVGYVAAANLATINLGGTIPDSNGNLLNILVGQSCTASLNTLPFSVQKQSGWTWNVSGITFQDWQPTSPNNPDASYLVGGSGPLTNSTAYWFWNDPNTATETVTCTATVTPNDGKTAPFQVSATQKVKVYLPTWDAHGVGGYMQVNKSAPNDSNPELWAGPTATMIANNQPGGMYWEANVHTPPQPAFGLGRLSLVQIATPNSSYTNLTPPIQNHPNPNSGMTGLDGTFPYGDVVPEAQEPLRDDDNPDIHLVGLGLTGNVVAGSAIFSSSYIDYLLYRPPGSDDNTRWIALAQFSWNTNGSATIPDPNNPNSWTPYVTQNNPPDKAGTVTPNTWTPFTGVMGPDFFPSWTSVVRPPKRF